MINGVLVERTVKDVVPALQTNAEGLKKVLDDLVKQYKTKQDDLEKWKVCHGAAPSLIVVVPWTAANCSRRKRTTFRLFSLDQPCRSGAGEAGLANAMSSGIAGMHLIPMVMGMTRRRPDSSPPG